jgi:excisionase family DNA binding protein
MMTNLPEFLTVDEVADVLRVGDDTVRNYIKIGVLPAVKLPHRPDTPKPNQIYRIRRDMLEQILSFPCPEDANEKLPEQASA